MNLTCPKCGSENTQKLSLVMSQGGTAEKAAKFGSAYVLNFVIPVLTVFAAFLLGAMFGILNMAVGALAFGGVLYGGYTLRKRLKAKAKSKYEDLPAQMKENGFQCNRCEHLFIPAS